MYRMIDEQLHLRPTIIADEKAPDDYEVYWNGLPIGRILKQPGVPAGRPNWHWGVNACSVRQPKLSQIFSHAV